MDLEGTAIRVEPVYFKNSDVPVENNRWLTVYEICKACEYVVNPDNKNRCTEAAQKIGDLWRVYLNDDTSRVNLLLQGITLRGMQAELRVSVWQSGMRLKYATMDGLSICYGEKGKRKKGSVSMLLLHGFTADKFMWVPLVRFLEQIGFSAEPYHLVGISMASLFQDEIHSVTMICPAMKTPVNSPFWMNLLEAIEDEVEEIHMTCDLLFPKTAAEVRKMLDHVNYHKKWVPKQILHAVAEFRKKYYPFHSRLFKSNTSPEMHDLLSDHVHYITAPSQIIWGENDQVIYVSGAGYLQKILPNCKQVDIIPRCDHSIGTDRPGAMTKAIKVFRQNIEADTYS